MIVRLIHSAMRGLLQILAVLPLSAFALTPSQVFDRVKDSVVVVRALNAQGKPTSQGSGVMLPSGQIATNCHVVKDGVRFQVGREKRFVAAELRASDGDKDLCLLEAKGLSAKPVALGKAGALKVGEAVYAVGSPQGLDLSLSNGIVSQLRGGPPPFIQTTAAISPGSSGGGLFDVEGRLVGITTFYLKGGQSLNFAVPAEWLAEIKPGRKTPPVAGSPLDWMVQAAAFEQKNDWRGLLDWGQQWSRADPTNSLAWFILGTAYNHLERYSDAIEAFREAVRLQPDDADAWNGLGLSYADVKRYTDAIEAYRQSLRLKPNDAGAWQNLGNAYRRLERYDDAIEAYRQTLRLEPDNAQVWNRIGMSNTFLKRYADAIDAYRQSLRFRPGDAYSWYSLGHVYGKIDRNSDAVNAYRESLRINPDDAAVWAALASTYYSSGNRQAALEAVRELRRYDPAKAELFFNLMVPK